MRCFIAVDLSKELVEKVVALQNELAGFGLKLVEPENLHFTLKFLGEVDVNVRMKVEEALSELAEKTAPFHMTVENIGIFPNPNYLRVIWVGAPEKEMLNLHNSVEQTLSGMFKKEKPIPHLTLARVRSQNPGLAHFIAKNKDIHIGKMKVDSIRLKKSTVTRNGPVYEDLAVFSLKGPQ